MLHVLFRYFLKIGMTVQEAYAIASQIEDRTIKEFDEIIEMNVIIEPIQRLK